MKTIYGHPLSAPCRTVQWYAKYSRKQLVEVHTVAIEKGENRSEEYLKKFPSGLVPGLEDAEEEFCFGESTAILQYLADGDPIAPKTRCAKAALQEYFAEHARAVRNLSKLCFQPALASPSPAETGASFTSGLDQVRDQLSKHNDALSRHRYILGDKLTLADFAFAPELDQLQFLSSSCLDQYPHLVAYLNRLTAAVTGYKESAEEAAEHFRKVKSDLPA
ncbi:Glutathione S-transferase 1 [Diplonema papillatum]|nr:Glutathione S-transferase 1 [Diplonema papillatum]